MCEKLVYLHLVHEVCEKTVYQHLLVCERRHVKFRWTGVSLCVRCVKGDV